MGGIGGLPGIVRILKPRFLQLLDAKAAELKENPGAAQNLIDALCRVLNSDQLLDLGVHYGLIPIAKDPTAENREHFRVHWLGSSPFFRGVPRRRRYEVIKQAMLEAATAVRDCRLPVDSSWVVNYPEGDSKFHAAVKCGDDRIALDFYTPEHGPIPGAAGTYVPDSSVRVIGWEEADAADPEGPGTIKIYEGWKET